MKKNIIFLALSISIFSFTLYGMEETEKKATKNSLDESFGIIGGEDMSASENDVESIKKKEFLTPEKTLEAILKQKVKTPPSTAIVKRIHLPLAYNLNKLFDKKWYIGFAKADGSGVAQTYQEEAVLMTLNLFSTLYIDDKEDSKKCSIVAYNFLKNLNKYRDLIKRMLNLTEIEEENEAPQQNPENEKKEVIQTPGNVYELIEQRFPGQKIHMRTTSKTVLENLLITSQEGSITVAMSEKLKQPEPTGPLYKQNKNLSVRSFLLGSSVTTLGLVSIIYGPKLYYWLLTR